MNKILLTCLFIFAFTIALLPTENVMAATQPVTGWAWSDTVGWVSFSSTNTGGSPNGVSYGVYIDESDGSFSGYAWNDAIGWISFNALETAQCGAPAQIVGVPSNVTGEIVGYARALSGNTSQSGGWTGCLELSGGNHLSPNISGNGGITYDDGANQIVGWAYGSIPSTSGGDPFKKDGIVGWLNFTSVFVNLNFEEPTLDLEALPNPASASGPDQPDSEDFPTTLYWTSSIPLTNCVASDDWSGSQVDPPSQENVFITSNPMTFTLTCEDSLGNPITDTEIVYRTEFPPNVNLSATPAIFPFGGGQTTLSWISNFTSSCVGGGWSTGAGSPADGGGVSVTVNQTTTFSIQCESVYNQGTYVTDYATVVVLPEPCPPENPECNPQGGEGIRPIFEEF